MAKVAFGFKASDGQKEDRRRIEEYIKKLSRIVRTSGPNFIYYIDEKENRIVFNLVSQTAHKTNKGVFVRFTRDELKFIDSLNFELDPHHELFTEQNVSDWFTKGE